MPINLGREFRYISRTWRRLPSVGSELCFLVVGEDSLELGQRLGKLDLWF